MCLFARTVAATRRAPSGGVRRRAVGSTVVIDSRKVVWRGRPVRVGRDGDPTIIAVRVAAAVHHHHHTTRESPESPRRAPSVPTAPCHRSMTRESTAAEGPTTGGGNRSAKPPTEAPGAYVKYEPRARFEVAAQVRDGVLGPTEVPPAVESLIVCLSPPPISLGDPSLTTLSRSLAGGSTDKRSRRRGG